MRTRANHPTQSSVTLTSTTDVVSAFCLYCSETWYSSRWLAESERSSKRRRAGAPPDRSRLRGPERRRPPANPRAITGTATCPSNPAGRRRSRVCLKPRSGHGIGSARTNQCGIGQRTAGCVEDSGGCCSVTAYLLSLDASCLGVTPGARLSKV